MTTKKTASWGAKPDPTKKHITAADPTDELIRSRAGKSESADTKPELKHITVNMSVDLHLRLKFHCVKHGTNVSEVLGKLAEKFLAEQE
jgi:ParG